MIEKVSFNNVQFKGNAPQAKETQTNTIKNNNDMKGDFYIDKKTADALVAYVAHPINNNKPIAMDTYIAQLKAAGMKEGEDFEVHGNTLFIRNYKNKDQLRKAVFWRDGRGAENYDGCDDVFYIQNADHNLRISYDRNGKMTGQAYLYPNADKHKNLFPENIDINTTAEDYMKVLDKQGIRYKTETKEHGESIETLVAEYSKDDEITKITGFHTSPYHKAIGQSIMDESGKTSRMIDLVKEGDRDTTLRIYQSIDEIMRAVENLSNK